MMRLIRDTSPVWSNIAYLAIWLAPAELILQLIVSALAVASALFHWYEYKLKFQRKVGWLEWQESAGYTWQRLDMILIYALFSAIFGVATGWHQVALVLFTVCLSGDLLGISHRFTLVAITAITATIGLIAVGAWLWVAFGFVIFILALTIREDAYSYPHPRNSLYHSLWHNITAISIILYCLGASL